ncbi:Cation/H+ exchanger [Lasiodiplodia theobromae]|uniref:Cation/H+ exchanger n=1 Tax=Lasiodiplodia theobromae TaxID=45133 RepID=UPI0015C37E4D|nr:Cation/H+ exchanger [Lasiodiplodia theobromae]KAF4541530.1 Cation/H+ exchanger [Lasiodiplodia theobromae]
MPELELTGVNIVLSTVGAFFILFGVISSKLKNTWYIGEALPAMLMGILLGPVAAKFIDSSKWASAEPGQQKEITHNGCRVVIGIHLVMAGFQLPARFQLLRWKRLIGMLPVMTIMWLLTSLCVFMIIPDLTWLSSLVIGSCLACTDPVLSQVIARGAFAEKYIPLHLREDLSSEAGANDSFAFPSLMLATFLIRHAAVPGSGKANSDGEVIENVERVGRIGGGVGVALKMWFLETWLYTVLLSIVYGALVGYASCLVLRLALRRGWIDTGNFFLFPTVIGLFVLGSAEAIGTEDLLACFAAGNALNWNGLYQEECSNRCDAVNPAISSFLNLGAFLYLGSVMPWDTFSSPNITYPRLFALGFALLLFRRIPATMISYTVFPKLYANAREALVLGHLGPLGVGAIFFAEHTRELFPELGEGDEEETNLIAALTPTVYWMVFFSIVVHGISVPIIHLVYKYLSVPTIQEGTSETLPFSRRASLSDKNVVERREQSDFKETIDHGTQSLDLSDLKDEAWKGHESVIGPFRWSVEQEYCRVTSDRCNTLA